MPFEVAISGLRAAQTDLEVIGNNVANVNTTGFKESRAEFHDVYTVAGPGVAANGPGQGVTTARISQQFAQGNITFTDNGLDLAISGEGFFVLDDNGSRVTRGRARSGSIATARREREQPAAHGVHGRRSGWCHGRHCAAAALEREHGAECDDAGHARREPRLAGDVPVTAVFDATDNTSFTTRPRRRFSIRSAARISCRRTS